MPTSNRAIGTTFESYQYLPFEYNGRSYILTDTVGLNEGDKGTVKATEAFKKLIELLKNSEQGYNLFVQVAKGRITKTMADNYKFFAEQMAQNSIPVLLVVTGCENVEPMSKWADENRVHYMKEDMDYKEIIATCFAETEIEDFKPRFTRLRQESKEQLLTAIDRYATYSPIKIWKGEGGIIKTCKRLWNLFCDWFEVENWKATINASLQQLLIRIGFSDEEATEIAKKWSRKKK